MKTLIILCTTLIMGCANLDKMTDAERSAYLDEKEDALYAKEDALLEAQLQYAQQTTACKKAGGVVIHTRQSNTRIKNVRRKSRLDYLHWHCANL